MVTIIRKIAHQIATIRFLLNNGRLSFVTLFCVAPARFLKLLPSTAVVVCGLFISKAHFKFNGLCCNQVILWLE